MTCAILPVHKCSLSAFDEDLLRTASVRITWNLKMVWRSTFIKLLSQLQVKNEVHLTETNWDHCWWLSVPQSTTVHSLLYLVRWSLVRLGILSPDWIVYTYMYHVWLSYLVKLVLEQLASAPALMEFNWKLSNCNGVCTRCWSATNFDLNIWNQKSKWVKLNADEFTHNHLC